MTLRPLHEPRMLDTGFLMLEGRARRRPSSLSSTQRFVVQIRESRIVEASHEPPLGPPASLPARSPVRIRAGKDAGGPSVTGARVHRAAGFSLMEVMCAILVLGIGLVGLTQGITAALRSNKEAERQTTAALIAAGQIELLRAEGYLTDGETEGEGGEGLSQYQWKQSVTSTAIDGLHEVSVVVQSAQSGEAIYELRTLLFEPPVQPDSNESSERKDSARKRGRSWP